MTYFLVGALLALAVPAIALYLAARELNSSTDPDTELLAAILRFVAAVFGLLLLLSLLYEGGRLMLLGPWT